MTTLSTAINHLKHSLSVIISSKRDPIPKEISHNACAIILIPYVQSGKQRNEKHRGLFMKLNEDGKWSWPVAIHITEGFIESNAEFVDVGDVLIIFNDPAAANRLLDFNELTFSGNAGGFLVSAGLFASRTYKLHTIPGAYSYFVSTSRLYGCDILSCSFGIRESSNQKYYSTRAATPKAIVNKSSELNIQDPNMAKNLEETLILMQKWKLMAQNQMEGASIHATTQFKEMTMDQLDGENANVGESNLKAKSFNFQV